MPSDTQTSPASAPALPNRGNQLLHAIALLEGIKGCVALAASIGLISLMHHDLRALAYAMIGHFHWDPDAHYPRMLIDEATWLQHADVRQIVFYAGAYATVRFMEGYGLWKDRSWAQWLAAGSGGIYLPIEISHLWHRASWINASVLVLNALIVLYMVRRLRRQKSAVTTCHDPHTNATSEPLKV